MGEDSPARKSSAGIVLHDFFAVPGGAEKLTATILEGLPGTDLCLGYVRPEAAFLLQKIRGKLIDLEAYSPMAPLKIAKVMQRFSQRTPALDDYDWALFSGSFAPLGARRTKARRNVLYCHTPPRFCYDLREHYRRDLPWYLRPALDTLVSYLEPRYREALKAMDVVIANSRNVQNRLAKYLGQPSVVIPPPIDVEGCRWISDGDYYLSTARLEPLKRVGTVIEAFRRMPSRRLVVASGGSERARLEQLASGAGNITFTGWLSEQQLQQLVGRAKAVIYVPIDEDFGMSPVEAMAAGKPVIGTAEGGLLETVLPGTTGLLIPPPLAVDAICSAVDEMERRDPRSMRAACEGAAKAYDKGAFIDRLKAVFTGAIGETVR